MNVNQKRDEKEATLRGPSKGTEEVDRRHATTTTTMG